MLTTATAPTKKLEWSIISWRYCTVASVFEVITVTIILANPQIGLCRRYSHRRHRRHQHQHHQHHHHHHQNLHCTINNAILLILFICRLGDAVEGCSQAISEGPWVYCWRQICGFWKTQLVLHLLIHGSWWIIAGLKTWYFALLHSTQRKIPWKKNFSVHTDQPTDL